MLQPKHHLSRQIEIVYRTLFEILFSRCLGNSIHGDNSLKLLFICKHKFLYCEHQRSRFCEMTQWYLILMAMFPYDLSVCLFCTSNNLFCIKCSVWYRKRCVSTFRQIEKQHTCARAHHCFKVVCIFHKLKVKTTL